MGAQASHAAQSSVPTVWPPAGSKLPLATFAGGCFWGVELAFQREPGVVDTAVGYTAGHVKNPTYEQVCSGRTGHTEAVQVTYDENQVSYSRLTELFLSRIDPTQKNRQGGDVGTQYRTGIYWHNEAQRAVAEAAVAGIKNCAVEVEPASQFWPAEEYHQQYLSKGGRFGSGQSAVKGCKDKIRCYG